MNQHIFVEQCLIKYRWEAIPEGQKWEWAHYPIPKSLGGTDGVWLWSCDHSAQGPMQSEEYDHPCIHGVREKSDRENLEKYHPEYIPLFEKWTKIRQQRAGRKSLSNGRASEMGKITRDKGVGIQDPKHKEKCVETSRKNAAKQAKKVLCVDTGVVYNNRAEASKATGVGRPNIVRAISRGIRAGGYHWQDYTG
jgi:hypothetical protein